MKRDKVTLAQLRQFLEGFGFEFARQRDFLVFEHKESGAFLVLRRYRANDAIGEADLILVRQQLDYRGFLERDAFDQALRTVQVGHPRA
jgi:hypothetical protein